MRVLQPRANPRNAHWLTRNEMRSAVRVRSSALFSPMYKPNTRKEVNLQIATGYFDTTRTRIPTLRRTVRVREAPHNLLLEAAGRSEDHEHWSNGRSNQLRASLWSV